MKVFAFPTWAFVMLFWDALPPEHPWKQHPRFTLQDWARHRTEAVRQFDFVPWFVLFCWMSGIVLWFIRR